MRTALTLTALAMTVTGCATEDPARAEGQSTATPTQSTTEAAAPTPLEGTWTTDLKRSAVRAYIRKAGWSRAAEEVLLDPDMAGPRLSEFRIDFVGEGFRMAQAATNEQWMSGTFTLDGDTIKLDDEAPVGVTTFRVHLDGDTATFDTPRLKPHTGEFMPGVEGWAPAAVLWCSTTWRRTS